ncbi:MAG: Methionine synthase [candidate division WS2 bacterium]|nr:Methionine synthase [Bacillota bacterium]MBT9151311.1 Methionine synthase [Candidatus Psychracetigena formicireducens]
MQELEKFAKFIETGDVERVRSLTEELLAKGITPSRIVEEGVAPGMDVVGQKYESGEYFLPELFMAGEAAKVVTAIIKPYLKKEGAKALGTVVIGSVFGDVHDVGKNLVASTLEGVGFKVTDLGTNVPSEEFVEAAKRENADIVAMSALITTTMLAMKDVIEALNSAGIRSKVMVMVGGAPLDEKFAKGIGADAYGKDPRQAVLKARELLSK